MQHNNSLNTIIRSRRSVKPEQYNTTPIAESIILEMLENARWAPTHARTEPWRFVVCTGDGLKRFAEYQAEQYKLHTPAESFNANKYDKLKTTPLKASHIILVGMKRQETEKLPIEEEIAAVACAVQNMLLTATANGIGAYWSTGGITYHQAMKNYMGLGEKDKALGMIYIGNYDIELPEGVRSGIEDKVRWEQ